MKYIFLQNIAKTVQALSFEQIPEWHCSLIEYGKALVYWYLLNDKLRIPYSHPLYQGIPLGPLPNCPGSHTDDTNPIGTTCCNPTFADRGLDKFNYCRRLPTKARGWSNSECLSQVGSGRRHTLSNRKPISLGFQPNRVKLPTKFTARALDTPPRNRLLVFRYLRSWKCKRFIMDNT